MRFLVIAFCFCLFSHAAYAEEWAVSSGTLQYTLKHMLHTVVGKTSDVKGIGKCNPECKFLVAAPVKSFSSDNSNRDSNMQKITRAATNPMVEMRTTVTPAKGKKSAEAEIKFAGKTHQYSVSIDFTDEAGGFRVQSLIPMKLSDFDIERPSLLGVATDDDVPVAIDLHLRKAGK
ncbi:MAG: YceI family protein [Bdellovibrionota bacterium]